MDGTGATKMNFYRIHIADLSEHTLQPLGLFAAVWDMASVRKLTPSETRTNQDNRKWFEANLPTPPCYADGNTQKAVTWYKNTEGGNSMCFSMAFYFDIAKKYSLQMYKSSTNEPPGTVIYEDEFQIAVVDHLKTGSLHTEKLIW